MELDDIAGTTKATILQTVVDAGYVKLIRLAADSTERLLVTAGGIEGYANNVKNFELASGIAYLGDQANEHIKLSSSGMQVYDGATQLALYGATVVIGEVGAGKSNIEITGGALNLRTNETDVISISSTGVASITINNGGNLAIKAGGDITMDGQAAGDPGILWLYPAPVQSRICVGTAANHHVMSANGNSTTYCQFYPVGLASNWRAGTLTAPYTGIDLNYGAGGDAGIAEVLAGAVTHEVYMTTHKFYTDVDRIIPVNHKVVNLGEALLAYNTMFADDFTNVADFYHLDTYNDIETIKNIKPSGKISKKTGLPLIDDDTLPEWMLSKYEEDGEQREWVRNKEGKRRNTGKILNRWKKGEIAYDPDGKPYLSLKLCISLAWGAIRELDKKIEVINEKIN